MRTPAPATAERMHASIRIVVIGLGAAWPVLAAAAESTVPAYASIRLFEQADGTVLPVARRLYTTRFDALRMRALGIEISATHAARDDDAEVSVACTLVRPDASEVPPDRPMRLTILAGQTQSTAADLLWRAADEEDWQPGMYLVRCQVDDMTMTGIQFEVALNPPDVPDTDIRVAALRLFPVERALPAKEDRRYGTTLAAAATHHIGVELEFTHAPLGRAMKVPVECYYFWPDGQTSPPLLLSYEPQPDWSGGYSAGALGWDQPGHWLAGVYTVTCMIYGRPVMVDRFDLQ